MACCFSTPLTLGLFACLVGVCPLAQAVHIASPGGLTGSTTLIDFSQFTGVNSMNGVNGPVQIGSVAGVNVTVQDMSGGSNIWLYGDNWGLGGNGLWDSGMNGYLGIFPDSGPVRVRFNDGPISGFGFFMNYPDQGSLPQTLRAYNAAGVLLDTYDVGVESPISTPSGTDAGAFRGIQHATADIAYVDLMGDTAVYDNLRYTVSSVPEPSAPALMLYGLLGFAGLMGVRRARRPTA